MRFVNWLENGQGSGDTESGVYTIGNGTDEARNPNATYFIPSKDEWYKAAYHKNDGVTGNYWDYPTSTDAIPYSDNPSSLNTPDNSNVANFYRDDSIANGYNGGYAVTDSTIDDDGQNHLTDVGAYPLAASPYDTFDQGGNVWEWTEEVSADPGRELRGGGWSSTGSLGLAYLQLSATRRITALPEYHGRYGFRVASIPEPSTALCAALASVTLFIRRRAKHQKLRPVSL